MRRLGCVLAVCVAVAGCGGGAEAERATPAAGVGDSAPAELPPEPTPQPLSYVADAKAALANGAIAVVDVTNRAGVEPRLLEVNREQRLTALRWTGWGSRRTVGRGDVQTLVCEPNCARGTLENSRGVIVLSAPKRCGRQRFYTRATMTYEEQGTGKTRAPATYLRTPPC
jgi:hypothetical protein